MRRTIVDNLISRQELAAKLASSIRDGKVHWAELDSLQRQLLLNRLNAKDRNTLEELVSARTAIDRNELLSTYVNAYSDKMDLELGKKLFVQHCQSCHAIGQTGHRVGPDLTAVAGRNPSDIIVDVLDPNRSVSADGFGYAILTKDDAVLSGLIAGETSTSVTLKKSGGELVSILREEIQELRHLGKSLMPEGFERSLTPKELASLVAYLKSSH
jgi:putative heme-binding domain-containing protein